MANPSGEERRLLSEVFEGLPRLGPGNPDSTRRALAAVTGLPPEPRVLDLGCGRGAQSLELATALGPAARVWAVDDTQPFLDALEHEAAARNLQARIETRRADISRLPFPPQSFDLLWAEGSIYLLGFERGLELWRPLLRPRGSIALTELCWLGDERPGPATGFWRRSYPDMSTADERRRQLARAGFEVVLEFALEAAAWDSYYDPLERRLAAFRRRHEGDPAASGVAVALEEEIALYRRFGRHYGYVFFVARLGEASVPSHAVTQ